MDTNETIYLMNSRRINRKELLRNLVNLRQLTFEVTDRCNLQCRYCGYGSMYYGFDERKGINMAFEQVKGLIDYLAMIWRTNRADAPRPLTYISFYGGEPLINISFIQQLVDYIHELDLNRRIIFSMTTNGLLLNQFMDYLVTNDFHLLISLDGSENEHSYRVDFSGNNSFYRVYKNVKILQESYPVYFLNNVNFNAVLHDRNSVESIHSFISKEFGKKPRISELNSSEIRPEKRNEFAQMYRNKTECLRQAENCQSLSDDLFMNDPSTADLLLFLHQYSGNVFRSYNELFCEKSDITCTPTGTCSPFSKKMFVTVNGKILQCEKIDHKYVLGRVSETELDLDSEKIANTFNHYLEKMKSQCSACYRRHSCIQCMYYIETLDAISPKCQAYMDENDFSMYCSFCLNHLRRHPYLYRKLMEEVTVE